MGQRSEELADYTETLYRRLKRLEDAARAVVAAAKGHWIDKGDCAIYEVPASEMVSLAAALGKEASDGA